MAQSHILVALLKPAYLSGMDHEIDALGLLCPLPVLKLAKRLKSLGPGSMVRLLADDPASVVDVPHFCNQSGHHLVETREADGTFNFVIRHKA